MQKVIKRLQAAIANPKAELNRWERFVLYIWQLFRQGVKQLSEDRANMMAASLTYRTLFGLLPVTVVGAGVARAIMGESRFEVFLYNLVEASGLNEVAIDVQMDNSITLGQWITDIVSSGMNINIAALTWVSLGVLVYSSIALMSTIEVCFNHIFGQVGGRSWLKRIPLYWFLLTFGPVLLAIAFWADSQIDKVFASLMPSELMQLVFAFLWRFLATWFSMYLLYSLVPTIKVIRKAALTGAFVATLLLLLGKTTLGLYFSHAISLKQLYGSLGLVPIFMFWLYLMWLIALLGLQVTSIVQKVSKNSEIGH